ncbi:MAG: hypothetical protein VYD19_00735 [Myxococcota bacterium]|nr:hypothetical protein [Myxococcota bacterium]
MLSQREVKQKLRFLPRLSVSQRAHLFSLLLSLLSLRSYAAEAVPPNTASSETETTDQLQDPRGRFRLGPLPSGWILLPTTDAKRISHLAEAGAIYRGQLVGLVLIEEVPELELRDYVEAVVGNISLEDFRLEEARQLIYAGRPAMRIRYSGLGARGRLRYQSHIFLHGAFAYQISVGGRVTDARDEALESFSSAFSLSAGRESDDADIRRKRARSGVAWSLEGEVFKDFAAMISMRVPEGWRPLTGAALSRGLPGSIFGLQHRDRSARLTIAQLRCPSAVARTQCRAEHQHRFEEAFQLPASREEETTVQVPFLGSALDITVIFIEEDGLTSLLAYGLHLRGEAGLQLTFRAPLSLPPERGLESAVGRAAQEIAMRDLLELLSRVQPLQAAEALQLIERAHRKPHPQSAVYAAASLVEGDYQHFQEGIHWQRPDTGLWSATIGEVVGARDPRARLQLWERTRDLRVLVLSALSYGQTLSESHNAERARLSRALKWSPHPAKQISHQKLSVQLSEAYASDRGLGLWLQLLSIERAGRQLHIQLWSPAATAAPSPLDQARFEEERRLVLANLQLGDARPFVTSEGGVWRDHQFAFELHTLQSIQLMPQLLHQGASRQLKWYSALGEGLLGVISIRSGQESSARALLLATLVGDHRLKVARGPRQYRGYPLAHYILEEGERRERVLLIERGALLYGIRSAAADPPLELWRRGHFNFIDVGPSSLRGPGRNRPALKPPAQSPPD